MSENGDRTGGSDRTDGTDGADDPERSPRERARRLAVRLRFLRMRERTANFENREAFRREIRRTEAALDRLVEADEVEVDAGDER